MDKKTVSVPLAAALLLLAFSVVVAHADISSNAATDATPIPLSSDAQTWMVLGLTAVLVAAYVAVILFLIVKKNKP